MNEEQIKKNTFKLSFFDTFPVEEFNHINFQLEHLGYKGTMVSNGNIVYEKKEADD